MSSKEFIINAVDGKADKIVELSSKVWQYAEVGFKEHKSVDAFCSMLEQEGFTVEKGLADMPTAFKASYGSGSPVIGFLAEYDALPMLSQACGVAKKQPVIEGEAGHGCGHNMLGAAVFGSALAVKEYIKENNISGTVVLFGCPSEEKGCGKTFMAREDVFKGVDAAFTWHPMDANAVWGMSSLANTIVHFTFKGKTAHAAAAPHLGRSALDGAELMNIGVNFLREHIIPEARVHYAFLDVGGDAPNVVQGTSKLNYYIRAPKAAQSLEIFERIKDIAKGAALMSGTEVSWEVNAGLSDYIPNKTLSTILQESYTEIGTPNFTEEEYKIAAEFFNNTYPPEAVEKNKAKVLRMYGKDLGEKLINAPLSKVIVPLKFSPIAMSGSTDVGDVSYVVPTAQLTAACYSVGTEPHTWQLTAQGDLSAAHKTTVNTAKVMALAAIKAIENPELIKQAKQELLEETGGKYVCPIPKEVKPKLDLE